MLVDIKQHQNWRCRCNPRQQRWVNELADIPSLLLEIEQLETSLKDNHRSRVLLGSIHGKRLIAKQPRDKNKRIWARILSYFEDSEVTHTLKSLERFHELNIDSVQPLFVLEKRVLGAVVDSWLCYEYREGVPSSELHLPRIVDLLHYLHSSGFRHNDPNLGNFLIDQNDHMFLLDCRGRKRSGNFSDANDFFLLKKINKTLKDFKISDIEGLDRTTWGFRVALAYNRIKAARSFIKDRLKKIDRKTHLSSHAFRPSLLRPLLFCDERDIGVL